MSNIPPTSAIHIARPAPNTVREIQVPPKAYLNFQFSLADASSAKNGDDLVIDLPDGSKVVCLGYYSNHAEGDGPQIAVNGEALPPSALDIGFFTHQVEGVRLQGTPEGRTEGEAGQPGQPGQAGEAGQPGQAGEAGQQAAAGEAAAGGKAPASSGATATGESAGDGGDGGDGGASQSPGAGPAAGQGSSSDSSSGSSSSSTGSSSSSSGSSSGSFSTEGSFKQDHNVDFLGGINRLPGLDLGSDRGFNNTDIEGGPIGGGFNNGTTPTPPPPTVPSTPEPTPPPLPDFSAQVSGLTEEGMHKGAVTTAGTKDTSHTFSLTLPDGMEAGDVRLSASLVPGAPSGELSPGTVYPSNYGDFSYSLTSKNVPVLDADGKPVVDADGKAVFRTEVEITLRYENLNDTHEDINSLPAGGKLDETLSFTVTGKDTSGNGTTLGKGDVTFVIEGSNDGPVLAKDASNLAAHFEVKEAGVYNDNKGTDKGEWAEYDPDTDPTDPAFGTHKDTTTIQLGVQDADKGDVLTYTLTDDPANPGTPDVSIGGTHLGKSVGMVKNDDGSYTLRIDDVNCGTLTFSASGVMTFKLDSNASIIQSMKAGEFSDLKLNVTVTDKGGLSDSGDITLTIHGTNDRPIFTKGQTFAQDIIESGLNVKHNTATGTLQGFDPEGDVVADNTLNFYVKDANGVHTNTTVEGKYGSLVLNRDGSYTYTENGSLRTGEGKPDSFTVVVKDKNGAYDEQELVFNVTGLNNNVDFIPGSGANYVIDLVEAGVLPGGNDNNDKVTDPKFAGMQKILVANDFITKLPNGGDFIIDDDAPVAGGSGGRQFIIIPRVGNDLSIIKNTLVGATQTIETTYGIFVFDIYSGEYTYTLKGGDIVNALNKDQTMVEKFGVEVWKDSNLVGTSEDFAVHIRGMNDMPVIKQVENFTFTEDDATSAQSFKTVASDIDNGDALTYAIVESGNVGNTVRLQDGTYGTLRMESDGTYTYELDNHRPATKQLGQHESEKETFTIRVTDTAGAWVDKEITVTINGSYDKPIISYDRVSVQEDGGVVKPAVEGETFGTGDKNMNTIGFTDKVHADDRSFAVVDADGNIIGTQAGNTQTIVTTYGTLVFNMADGSYSYTMSADTNRLYQGKNIDELIATEKFTVRVTFNKDKGQTENAELIIDLKGTNDKPVFVENGSDFSISLERTHPNTTSPPTAGTVWATDVDNDHLKPNPSDPDAPGVGPSSLMFCFKIKTGTDSAGNDTYEYVQNINTTYGRVTINADTGKYEYHLDNLNASVRGLGAGNKLADEFNVVVRDPHGAEAEHKVTVDINGKDFPAGPGGNDSHDLPTKDLVVKEDSNVGVSAPNNPGQEDTSGPGGDLPNTVVRYCFQVLDKDGNVVMADGKPVMSQSMKGTYGDIYIDAYTGEYRYVLNNQHSLVQALAAGQTGVENFKVYTFTIDSDGTIRWDESGTPKHTIKVAVEGANDAPELTHATVAQGMQIFAGATGLKTSGKFSAKDVDTTDKLRFSLEDTYAGEGSTTVTKSFTWGSVTLDTITGEYTYTFNSTATLVNGVTEKFWVYVNDNNGGVDKEEVSITITPANARPVIVSCILTEGETGLDYNSYAHGSATPNLNVDPITGEVTLGGVTLPASKTLTTGLLETTTNLKGSFTSWDYEVNVGGQGANSKYYLCNASGTGLKNLISNEYGTLELKTDGTFTFTLNNTSDIVMSMQEGAPKNFTYYVVVRDAKGLTSAVQEFKITITGTNNKPNITATQGLIEMGEDGTYIGSASGNRFILGVQDADLYKTNFVDGEPDGTVDKTVKDGHDFSLTGTATDKGAGIVLDTSGKIDDGSSYSFVVKNADGIVYGTFHIEVNPNDAADVQYWFVVDSSMKAYLTMNQNVTLNFKLQFNDGSGKDNFSNEAQVNVTIKGDNTVPAITVDTGGNSIVLTESDDGSASANKHTVTVTDNDLGSDRTEHDFDLSGSGTTTIGKETKTASGVYEFEVLHKGVVYGTLHMQVNASDPTEAEYWFVMNAHAKDNMFAGDIVNLTFGMIFKDDFSIASTPVGITVTLNGEGTRPTITTSHAAPTDGADAIPDAIDDTAAAATGAATLTVTETAANLVPDSEPATALAPEHAAPATALVPELAAPNVVLPGGTLAEAILNEALGDVGLGTADAPNADVAGAGLADASLAAGSDLPNTDLPDADLPNAGLVNIDLSDASADAAAEHVSGDAPAPLATQATADAQVASNPSPYASGPLTLETPLSHAPMQDMTSAPGQEALQFQLQTTGV